MARPPRPAREIERTRQEILAAAARVFAAAGYHGATMQAIAREAGFTAASLYGYFRSKDELYDAILADVTGAMLAVYDAPVPAGLDLEGHLALIVERQLEIISARRAPLRILLERERHLGHAEETSRAFVERMTRLIADARPALRCPPEEATGLLFGILQAYFIAWLRSEGGDAKALAARVVGFFLHGAAAPPLRRG